jgi:hypothetical protein
MKLNSKTRTYLVRFVVLGTLIGTLAWAILERLLGLFGLPLDLSVGPLGIDVYVFSLFFRANPGTLAGMFLGYRLFVSA